MLREGTAFAQKIIDFYTDKGIDCSVVDEHLSLLVTLSANGRTHEFRYGRRAFAGAHSWKKFYRTLDREFSNLKTATVEEQPAHRSRAQPKYRFLEDAVGGI